MESTTKVGRARKGEGEERQRDGKGENEGEEERVEEEVSMQGDFKCDHNLSVQSDWTYSQGSTCTIEG